MKHKIKPKYLDKIIKNKEMPKENCIVKEEALDTIKKTLNFTKALGLILLMLFWSYIPLIFLMPLKIDYTSLKTITKIIYVTSCDLSFLALLIYIYRKDFFKDFKNFFNKNKIRKNIKTSLKYWSLGLLIMIISNLIIGIINNGGMPSNEESVRELIDQLPLYMFFNIVIYAPLTEELIFRKSFKNAFSNKYLYILTSGLIFGSMHIVSDLSSYQQLLYIIPYSSLGIAFAALYKKTNNIFSTISIHAFHNFLTLLLYIASAGILWRKYYI